MDLEISTGLIEQLSEPECDSEQEDLPGTGLLDEENDEQSDSNTNNAAPSQQSNEDDTNNAAPSQESNEADTNTNNAAPSQESNENDANNALAIKPPVLAKFLFASDTIVIDPDEKSHEDNTNNALDIKPPVLAKFCFASDTIVIDSDLDAEDVVHDTNSHGTDVIFEKYDPPKYGRTQHQRRYDCYVCDETFDMQQLFVVHFQSRHPTDPFKCCFCSGDFHSPNGLFKHERSHEYMKYLCIVCAKRFQFPYQLTNHQTVHTGLRRHKCDSCDKTFGSKCSRDFHQKTHGVELQCDLCPMNSTKTFNNDVALKQYQRGIHGPRWNTPCGENKKWKSAYGKHPKECKKCIKIRADAKMNRFSFMKHVDLTIKREHD